MGRSSYKSEGGEKEWKGADFSGGLVMQRGDGVSQEEKRATAAGTLTSLGMIGYKRNRVEHGYLPFSGPEAH